MSERKAEPIVAECWTCGVDLDECDSCGAYHHKDYMGDCRNDAERFNTDAVPLTAEQARQHRKEGHDVATY